MENNIVHKQLFFDEVFCNLVTYEESNKENLAFSQQNQLQRAFYLAIKGGLRNLKDNGWLKEWQETYSISDNTVARFERD